MQKFSQILKLLNKNFEDLESFIDLLPIGIYITLPDGQFTLINKYIVNIFGFDSKEEFVETFKTGCNAYKNSRTRDLFVQILKNEGKVKDFYVEYKTKCGEILFANENATAIFKNEEMKYIFGVIENITEQTREQKEKLETSYFISSLNEALLELIKSKTPKESIYNIFDTIGRHLGIVSIYSFLTKTEGDEIFSENEITWVNKTLMAYYPKLENRKINFLEITPLIVQRVSSGKYFCTTDCEIYDYERKVLNKFSIKSLLATPIIFEDNYIGYILYIDTINDRVWKDYEIKLLSFLANSIGSNYINFANESVLVNTNQRLYAVINSIPGPVNIIKSNLEIIDSNQWITLGWEPKLPDKIANLEDIRFDTVNKSFYDVKSIQISQKTGKPTVRLTTDFEDEVLGLSLLLITQPIINDKNEIWAYVQIGLDVSELRLSQKLLRETIRTKDKFFDIIAHDLRNPINALNTLLDDLLRNYNKLSLNEIYYSNLQIQESIIILSQLLNNLLEWARSQTGRINYHPDFIDASYIARNVTEINFDIARIKNITIDNQIDYGTIVYVDSNMLYTILRNLVSNAMKYSNPYGIITIQAQANDDFTVFSVSDNGVGISKDRIDKLFKLEFVQSTKGTNQEKGTGLGLILCKEFVEKNGGKIWVESTENVGTTFYFSVPRHPLSQLE